VRRWRAGPAGLHVAIDCNKCSLGQQDFMYIYIMLCIYAAFNEGKRQSSASLLLDSPVLKHGCTLPHTHARLSHTHTHTHTFTLAGPTSQQSYVTYRPAHRAAVGSTPSLLRRPHDPAAGPAPASAAAAAASASDAVQPAAGGGGGGSVASDVGGAAAAAVAAAAAAATAGGVGGGEGEAEAASQQARPDARDQFINLSNV
jgi:hypothetical protein